MYQHKMIHVNTYQIHVNTYHYRPIHTNTCEYMPIRTKVNQYIPIHTNISIHTNTHLYAQIRTQYVPIHANTCHYIPNTSQYMQIHANTCHFTLYLRAWMANRMQRSPDPRVDDPNITANDQLSKSNSEQKFKTSIVWYRQMEEEARHARTQHS